MNRHSPRLAKAKIVVKEALLMTMHQWPPSLEKPAITEHTGRVQAKRGLGQLVEGGKALHRSQGIGPLLYGLHRVRGVETTLDINREPRGLGGSNIGEIHVAMEGVVE